MSSAGNIDFSVPSFKKAMKTSAYIELHKKTLQKRNLERIRRNELNAAIMAFESFLKHVSTVNPNEELTGEFISYCRKQHPHRKPQDANKQESLIRTNHNLFPGIQRPLVSQRKYAKLKRLNSYTPQTRELFEEFLRDGRRISMDGREPIISTLRLAEATRKSNVSNVRMLLKLTKIDDVTRVGNEQVEMFISEHAKQGAQIDQSNHLLANMKEFFRYLWAKGLIDKSPVAHIIKPKRMNDDYVEQDGIDSIMNLDSLDWDDFCEVRDRFITVCLYYDFALRNEEASNLDAGDIGLKDFIELNLRADIQSKCELSKAAKRDILMRNFFKESRILAERYMELRNRRNPKTNALLLSEKNNGRLGTSGCCGAVQRVCKQLGISTLKDKTPAPHRLRHSMATLNIRPLGIKLELRQIQKRMRHRSITTTEQIYIANNPLLDKAEHEAWAEDHESRNGNGNGKRHSRVLVQSATPEEDSHIPEADALRMLRPLGIKQASLNTYAQEQGMMNSEGEYSEDFINDLATTYYTKDEAMGLLRYKKSGFYYWVKSNGIEQLFIGRVMLIKKDDVMNKVRGE